MKIRAGFVSNSSSSSFTIYGYLFDDFSEGNAFYEKMLKEKIPESVYAFNQNGDIIVGVGEEVDHIEYIDVPEGEDYNDDWRDYVCAGPSGESILAMKGFVKDKNVDKELETHSETFYDG